MILLLHMRSCRSISGYRERVEREGEGMAGTREGGRKNGIDILNFGDVAASLWSGERLSTTSKMMAYQ